jgi:hypothetical protein
MLPPASSPGLSGMFEEVFGPSGVHLTPNDFAIGQEKDREDENCSLGFRSGTTN